MENEVIETKASLEEEWTEQENSPEAEPSKKKNVLRKIGGVFRDKKKRKWLILILLLLLIAGSFFSCRSAARKKLAATTNYLTDTVSYRSLTATLTGSGTLMPADSYTVSTLIQGEIAAADFSEGDMVTKDSVLYQVDSADVARNVERAELSLAQAQQSYARKLREQEDLAVKTGFSGAVSALTVKLGDRVMAGQAIGTVKNSDSMSIDLPFPADDAQKISVGASATLTLDGSFETLYGSVRRVATADTVLPGNLLTRTVTIEVKNPGALSDTQRASATVGGSACSASAAFTPQSEITVVSDVSGEVTVINAPAGTRVSAGQTLVTLQSDNMGDEVQSAANSVRDAQLNLENQLAQLENYTIKSPIQGTIIEKNYKAGDTLEAGKTLCTIYDLSYLEMELNVDELDISRIQEGQKVKLTVEAVEGKSYEGVITKRNIKGSTTGAATTYPVTIRFPMAAELLPGMNGNVEIITAERDNALTIPADAVVRGDKVLVQGALPDGSEEPGTPEGYGYVPVTVGILGGDYVEILSGLSEGDTITYIKQQAQGSSIMDFMMGGPPQESEPTAPPAEGGKPDEAAH